MTNIYQQWEDALRGIGEWHISIDKCAKIIAIIYDNGGNNIFCLSSRFITEWKRAHQRLYILGGTEIPSDKLEEVAEGQELIRKY